MNTLRVCESCGGELPADAAQALCPDCLKSRAGPSPPRPRGLFAPPALETLKAYFPQLELLDLLGYGGMGAVYRARPDRGGSTGAMGQSALAKEVEPVPARRAHVE